MSAYNETMLIFGGPNVGKTTMLLEIARENPERDCWFFDFENKLSRVAQFYGGVPKNVKRIGAFDVPEVLQQFNTVVKPALKAKPESIVLVDMVDQMWERSQEFYSNFIYEETTLDFLLAKKKALIESDQDKRPATFEGYYDWPYIKKIHNSFVDVLFKDSSLNCHVFATAPSRELRPPMDEKGKKNPMGDDPEIYRMFQPVGVAPAGEKRNPFRFNTIMLLRSEGTTMRKFDMSILKDVSRTFGAQTLVLGKPLTLEKIGNTEIKVASPWVEFCTHVGITTNLGG